MNLNVREADQLGTDFLSKEEALALSGLLNIRAADRVIELDVLPDAGVHFLAIRDIRAETAGRDNHAVLRHHRNLGAEVVADNSHHTAALILNELHGRCIEEHLNLAIRIRDHLFKRTDIGIAVRGRRIVRTLAKRPGRSADMVVELHAEAFQPVHGVH